MTTSSSLKENLENALDVKATRQLTVKAMKSDHSNSYLYDRDPKIHHHILKIFRPELDKYGTDTWVDDYGNLIARVGENKTGKRVLVIQHAQEWGPTEEEEKTLSTIHEPGDVVPVEKLGIAGFDPAKHHVHGEVVWGRGGCEATGGCVAAVEAVRMLARSGVKVPGQAIFVITAGGHSAASDNIFHLLINDEIKADMAIHQGIRGMANQAEQTIATSGGGRIDLRLTVLGRVSHSSNYSPGFNAVDGALTALERLKKIMPIPNDKVDPQTGQKTRLTNIGIESFPKPPGHLTGTGSAGHTLQGSVRILLDRRILPSENVDDAIGEIRSAVGDLSPFPYRVERGAFHFPWHVPRNSQVAAAVSQSVTAMTGSAPDLVHVTAAWDMGAVNKLGIPCVMYGTSGPMVVDPPIGPHCENDFATLDWIYDAAKVYAHFAVSATE